MKVDLELAKQIVMSFLDQIQEMKRMQSHVSFPQMAEAFSISNQIPLFDLSKESNFDSKWEIEAAYYWLYAKVWHF